MKKTTSFILTMAILMVTLALPASAAAKGDISIFPFANDNVSKCAMTLSSSGGRINIIMTVVGNGTQDKLGVSSVEVSEKVNGKWSIKTAFTCDEDQEEFFDYNTSRYSGTTYYDGVPGREYQIKIYAVGQKGSTSGSKTYSATIVCK